MRKQDLLLTRRAAYLTAIYMRGSKDVGSEEKFWPLEAEARKPWQPTREQYDQIMNRYKIKK